MGLRWETSAVMLKMNSKKSRKGHTNKPFRLLIGLMLISLVGCNSLPFNLSLPWINSTQPPESSLQTETSQPVQPTEDFAAATSTPAPAPEKLVVWLPPELNPKGNDQAAALLQSRLDAFSKSQGLEIQVRIKNLSGTGGLLDVLTVTNAAAPAALPDLIVLNQKDMETAALKSLIYPLDSLTAIVDGEDWFPYSRNLSLIQNVVYGIPFVGDPLTLVYDSTLTPAPLPDWTSVAANAGRLALAIDDAQALYTLTLYLSLGGQVEDNQRHPMLEVEPLTEALQLLKDANIAGRITQTSLQYQDKDQVWEAFDKGQADMVVVPVSRVLQALKQDRTGLPQLALAETPNSIATGWVLAVTTAQPERQKLAVALAEDLVKPDFLAGWTEALGRLPARPSALDAWQDLQLKPKLSIISSEAVVYPSNEVMTSVAPVLRNATLLILRDNADPSEMAKQAVESLQ